MLVRVAGIKGIGLFHDVHPASLGFKRVALIYAENGRGKSTFSSILESCSTGAPQLVDERRTIDGTFDPSVELHFDSGSHPVTYNAGAWSETRPEIFVYDAAFVNRNVYSGTEVTSENRKNLLDFALGADAVLARLEEESATRERNSASEAKRELEAQLKVHAGNAPLRGFLNLDEVPDVDTKIASAEDRLAVARREVELRAHVLPALGSVPELDFDRVFEVLNRTLESVHEAAEALVADHLRRYADPGVAKWIGEGQSFDDGQVCPYCGQDTSAVELIEMYRSHFDQAYQQLQADIRQVTEYVVEATHPRVVAQLKLDRDRANETLTFWKSYAGVSPITDERDDLAAGSMENVRNALETLLGRKALAVTDGVGLPGDRQEIDEQWSQLAQIFRDQNDAIGAKREAVKGLRVFNTPLL